MREDQVPLCGGCVSWPGFLVICITGFLAKTNVSGPRRQWPSDGGVLRLSLLCRRLVVGCAGRPVGGEPLYPPQLMGVRGERRGPERQTNEPNKVIRALMVALPAGAILWSATLETHLYDRIRIFVLAQAAVVVMLYVQALYSVILRVSRPGPDRSTNEIRRGHLCLLLAIFVLLAEEIVRVAQRLGQDHLNWRTPLLQIALLLLFLGWLWLERRRWRTDDELLRPTPREEARGRARRRVQRHSG